MCAVEFDHEAFKNILAGIQSLVLSLAALGAGTWALFRFSALGEARKAQAELKELQKKLQEHETLHLSMHVSQEYLEQDRYHYVTINVIACNKGNRLMYIQFPNSRPLSVSRVSFNGNNEVQLNSTTFANIVSPTIGNPIACSLNPSEESQFAFILRIKEKGIYFLEFSVAVTIGHREVALDIALSSKDVNISKKTPIAWSTKQYVIIK